MRRRACARLLTLPTQIISAMRAADTEDRGLLPDALFVRTLTAAVDRSKGGAGGAATATSLLAVAADALRGGGSGFDVDYWIWLGRVVVCTGAEVRALVRLGGTDAQVCGAPGGYNVVQSGPSVW